MLEYDPFTPEQLKALREYMSSLPKPCAGCREMMHGFVHVCNPRTLIADRDALLAALKGLMGSNNGLEACFCGEMPHEDDCQAALDAIRRVEGK